MHATHATTLLLLGIVYTGCGDNAAPASCELPSDFGRCIDEVCSPGSNGGGGITTPRLAFGVQPGGSTARAAITPAVQVTLLDALGSLAFSATDSVTISISSNPGGGTLSGATRVVVANGVATFANLSIDKVGEGYTLTASAPSYAPHTVSTPFNVACACWSKQPAMPTRRQSPAVGVVNGVVHVFGGAGYIPYNVLDTVEAYDPITTLWTTKASMPTPRSGLAVGVVNGVLYAVGGGYRPTVEAYDPVANTWTTKAPMPTPRSDLAVGVVNGVLYVVGGYNGTGYLTTVEAYDPVADSWTTKAPMPTPRSDLAVGVVNGVLYVVGGYNSLFGGSLATVEAYDPGANTWTTRAPMPTPRYGLGAGVVNGVLYALGGRSWGDVALGTVEAYDPRANGWTTRGPMLTSRYSLGVGVVNGSVYVVGGYKLGALATIEKYDPAQDR